MRRLNLVFLAILLVGMALLGGGMHLVHGFQMHRNAARLLDRAHRAEDANELARVDEVLGHYLSLRDEDAATWSWYARVVDRRDTARARVERSYLVSEQALRHNPADRDLKRRCADLAMELGRHGDAQRLLTELFERAENNAKASERAELEDLLGQCEEALGRYEDAGRWFAHAIEHDPHRVDAFDRLARLLRTKLGQDEQANATIRDMIARNDASGRAYAYRWRYARDLAPPANDRDVAKALELAPDDREVLITAAMAAEQKQDLAAMRTYLARGHERDPKDIPFAESLARVETRAGHLDRAEAVLRRSFEARPLAGLAFELADTLILEGKIEGKDGASALIDTLRRAGLGETLVRFLDAEVLFQGKKWNEAIAELQTARAVLGAAPELVLRINLMIAECHGRLGSDDDRLEALRRAAEGKEGAETARLELVRALEQSGRLDQAIATLSPMAIGGTNPAWRLDLVRLLLRKAIRQPRDRRNWPEIERRLDEAEKALSSTSEPVVLLRLDVLAAQNRLDEARTLLSRSLAREPRNLGYRLAMARLTQIQHRDDEALQFIDQAEKDLGTDPRITLARLDYWERRGGDTARTEVARLASSRNQIAAADRPAFLDRLGAVAIRLGRPDLARQYWRELAALQPENITVRLGLFDLALMAGDHNEPPQLIQAIRKIEGETGTNWRFAQAAWLLDQARHGRGRAEGVDEARRLAAEIVERKPNWWVGPTLNGEIAEQAGSVDQAISYYLQALEAGNTQPSFARRLVLLLDQRGRRAEVERVTQVLRDQGAALAEITIVQALDAIRARDYDRAISLARQLYPDGSPNASDHLNLGRIYLAAGRADEAGRQFRRAVELGPGAPENWLAYVEYLANQGQRAQARSLIESARKVLPPDRAALTLARCALAVGDNAGAEALIDQAMAVPGAADDLAAQRVAVDVNLRLKKVDAARSFLDRIAASPSASADDHAWATRTRAALLLTTNRPADREQALALLDRNLADSPESVEDQTLKATILAMRPASRAAAIAILERLAQTNRLADEQRFLLAQLHLGQGQAAVYEDEMRGLLNRKEKDPRHQAHFINHWIGKNQLDEADRWLAELKQADPRGRPALELEARLLDARKRRPELLALLEARAHEVPDEMSIVADLMSRYGFLKEAEATYRAFGARDQNKPEQGLALAAFLVRQDRVAEAMEILRRARTTCSPEKVAAAALLVFDASSAKEDEKREAEGLVAAAVQGKPEATLLASRLGAICIRRGRFDEAERMLRSLLRRDPDAADTINCLAWLLAIRDGGRAAEAIALVDRAILIHGPAPSLVDTRAVARIRMGQVDEALQDLIAIRKSLPSRPSFALHLAWAYQVKGQLDLARVEFQEAERLGLKPWAMDPMELEVFERLRGILSRR